MESDYWSKRRQAGTPGHWLGDAVIHRTPTGFAVVQYEWWQARIGKVGHVNTRRYFRTRDAAERCVARLAGSTKEER